MDSSYCVDASRVSNGTSTSVLQDRATRTILHTVLGTEVPGTCGTVCYSSTQE